jgi:hypothetical protein
VYQQFNMVFFYIGQKVWYSLVLVKQFRLALSWHVLYKSSKLLN